MRGYALFPHIMQKRGLCDYVNFRLRVSRLLSHQPANFRNHPAMFIFCAV
jgi:hypothetical protein